jgi:hypothetical protein
MHIHLSRKRIIQPRKIAAKQNFKSELKIQPRNKKIRHRKTLETYPLTKEYHKTICFR